MKQVLLNLLSNAMKFTPPTGAIQVDPAENTDGALDIWISDTGIGMSPDEIEAALKPFFQIDSSLARRYEGTGLGLPLAVSFMRLHGGSLKVESTPGVGAIVRVTFPSERLLKSA